jgi:TolB-like protein
MRIFVCIVGLLMLGANVTPSRAQTEEPRVALLPLLSLATEASTRHVLTRAIADELRQRHVALADSAEIERILRKYRLRNPNALSAEQLKLLCDESGATYVLCGLVQRTLRADDVNEIALSLRLINAEQQTVVWANSADCTTGKARSIVDWFTGSNSKQLERRAAQTVLRSFRWESAPAKTPHTALLVAPLRNESTTAFAGQIASAELTSVLWHQGYSLVDPGITEFIIGEHTRRVASDINQATLRALNSDYHTAWMVAGEVSALSNENELSLREAARAAVSLRLISTETGNVAASALATSNGTAPLAPFGASPHTKPIRLCNRVIDSAVEALHIEKHATKH